VTSSTLPLATLGAAPAEKRPALGRCELWWMKSFHGVCVPCSFVPLRARGTRGSLTSNAAAPPEPVCHPAPAASKSQ